MFIRISRSNFLRFWIALCLCASISPVIAGLFDDDEARRAILDLRQKIETNRQQQESDHKSLSEENVSIRRSLVDLQNQLNTTRSEVEKLRGQNEQLVREIAESQRKYKDFTQNLQLRISNLEPAKVSLDGLEFLATADETRDFNEAFSLFRNGDFVASSKLFNEFMVRYPRSGYLPSVLFWHGNAQYANKEYKDALASFRRMLNSASNHNRAPEAMLAVANCQVEMKELKSARKTWETLISTYPESEAAAAARDRLSRFK